MCCPKDRLICHTFEHMGTSGIKGIVFDFDGTMGFSLPHWATAYQGALAEFGAHRELPEVIEMCFSRRTAEVLRELAITEPEAFRESVWGRVKERMHLVEPYPGFIETLGAFKASSVRAGIATNSRFGHVSIALERWGILESFHAVVAVDHVPRGKPHPDALHRALELMEVSPSDAIMFGDSPIDIHAGHAAGMTTVAFCPSENHQYCPLALIEAAEPTHIVSSHRELHELVLSL
jgi:HAD superfamily hydrolase (TIGR01509 family)